jgi:hypothetical protein
LGIIPDWKRYQKEQRISKKNSALMPLGGESIVKVANKGKYKQIKFGALC